MCGCCAGSRFHRLPPSVRVGISPVSRKLKEITQAQRWSQGDEVMVFPGTVVLQGVEPETYSLDQKLDPNERLLAK